MERDWGDDVLEEMLSLILSNLVGKDRHCFSLVCKRWNKTAKFGKYSPCLMNYERSNGGRWKLYHYNGCVSMDLAQKHLNGAEIRCAKHGWILMSKDTDLTMFFYDPFNNETIHLPKPDSKYSVISFFHPPTSRDCFIVGAETVLEYDNRWVTTDDTKIGVLRRGENAWRERVYQGESPFILSLCTPVLHGQLLHFLDLDGNIGTFDAGSPAGSWTVQPEYLLPPAGRILQLFLIELRDEQPGLLCVLVTLEKVKVFRMLFSGPRTWAPVEDLEDKVLFLSRKACFAATAPWRSVANRIYFAKTTRGDVDDDDVVFYCLGTGRYRLCKGDFSSKEPHRLPDLNFAAWIVATPTPESPRDLTW